MPEVRSNQMWIDADPRISSMGKRRMIRVVADGDPTPSTARVVSWYEKPDGAGGWVATTPQRSSTIKLARFVPSATGYRLIKDAS